LNYRRLIVLWILCCAAVPAVAEDLLVAVAANFMGTMRPIAADFEQQSGHRVRLVSGSSGKLFAQIRNGAPYDLFFSADQEKPRALEAAGMVMPGSRLTYATGALVLWAPSWAEVDAMALQRESFKRLAVANPRLAPYGAAAMDVLQHLQLLPALTPKLVYGENVAQAFQFVDSGNAELGMVALSQVLALASKNKATATAPTYWLIPRNWYRPIKQDAVLLQAAEQKTAAQAFLAFFQTDVAAKIMNSHGYQIGEQGVMERGVQ